MLVAGEPGLFLHLLNRLSAYVASGQTLTGTEESMMPTIPINPQLAIGSPWGVVTYVIGNRAYHLAVLVRHYLLRDVIVYTDIPDAPHNFSEVAIYEHDGLINHLISTYGINPAILMLYYWEPVDGENDRFYRVLLESSLEECRVERRTEVKRSEVMEAANFPLERWPTLKNHVPEE
ncbi:MAG: hypothetical protein ACYTGS_00835 [Planctomycetota bacterium]